MFTRRRVMALLLAAVMAMSVPMPVSANAAEQMPVQEAEAEKAEETAADKGEAEATEVPGGKEEDSSRDTVFVSGGYTVEYKVESQWGTTYQGNITITNTGREAIRDWSLEFASKDIIKSVWDAKLVSGESNQSRIENAGWNQDIQPGAKVSFGFSAEFTDAPTIPEAFRIPGQEIMPKPTPSMAPAEENEHGFYQGGNFSVEYFVESKNESSYQGKIVLTNTGEMKIENWALSFASPDSIKSIWDAQILSYENQIYQIKNAGWNQDIRPGESVSFGFAGECGGSAAIPASYRLLGKENDVEEKGYEVLFQINSKWQEGYSAAVTIWNRKAEAIEDWQLSFDLDKEIASIWNGEIAEASEGHYVINNAGHNAVIKPGESISFGMEIKTQGGETLTPENFVLQEVSLDGSGYGVLFDFNFEGSQALEQMVSQGACAAEPKLPERADFVFRGWYTTRDCIEAYDFAAPVTAPLELFAKWQDTTKAAPALTGGIVLVATGFYNPDEDGIYLSWISTAAEGSFTVFCSDGSSDFVECGKGSAEGDSSFMYHLGEADQGRETLYFKVVQAKEDGSGAESNHVCMRREGSGYKEQITDTDGDGLADYKEELIGADINNADTDGDTLTDYQEYCILGTDPLLADSDWNGVKDQEEDLDRDALSNGEELNSYGTDPLIADSDCDRLSDKDEAMLHFTDPLKADTDEDGLSDYTELFITKTDPLHAVSSNTEGIRDGDYAYTVTVQPDEANMDENLAMSLELTEVAGKQLNTLEMEKVQQDPLLTSEIPGYIGAPYSLTMEGAENGFAGGGAKLTFTFSEEQAKNKEFVPCIYYYNEETQRLEEVKTQSRDGNSVTAELEHFSTYILVDKTEYGKVWQEIKKPTDTSTKANVDIVFVIDSSGSMTSNDRYGVRKTVAVEFINRLTEGDRAAVVDFDSYSSVLSRFTSDKAALRTAINRIDSSGGTNLSGGISAALNLYSDVSYQDHGAEKYIFMLTDGDGNYSASYTKMAADRGIVIHSIGLGNSVNTSVLTNMAIGTGGKYYYADKAGELYGIFEEVAEDTDMKKDTDSDGINDYYEKKLGSGDMRLGTGTALIGLDYTNADTDGESLKDGQELEIVVGDDGYVYAKMKSNPLMMDTDGDGYTDDLDQNPLSCWKAKTPLGRIVESAGFLYDENQDIIYSRVDAQQRNLGFSYAYDEGIVAISSVLDVEPIYFFYGGKEWMIELWKGQYGIETGGEVGIYNRNAGDLNFADVWTKNRNQVGNTLVEEVKNMFGGEIPGFVENGIRDACNSANLTDFVRKLDKMTADADETNWIDEVMKFVTDKERAKRIRMNYKNLLITTRSMFACKLYACADDSEMLPMSYQLSAKQSGILGSISEMFGLETEFGRDAYSHWWLTGFEWGKFTKTSNSIEMDVAIDFKDEEMAKAFVEGKDSRDEGKYGKIYQTIEDETVVNLIDNNNDNNGIFGIRAMGYRYLMEGKRVRLTFTTPKSKQPVTRSILGEGVQLNNSAIVGLYNSLKYVCNIDTNDPDEIYNTIYSYVEHQDQIDAAFYDRFYSRFHDEMEKYADEWYEFIPFLDKDHYGKEFKEEYREGIATFLQRSYENVANKIDKSVNAAFRVAAEATKQ